MYIAASGQQMMPVVAFGPELQGWGSWGWVGADLKDEFGKSYQTITFGSSDVPQCDVLVIIKHPISRDAIEMVAAHAAVVYLPVDRYGAATEIDTDVYFLRKCSRVVVHCERLRRYFEPYAPVEYLDHHVKFVTDHAIPYRQAGPILWVGARSNLPPLVAWANTHPLPGELLVLTNPEMPGEVPSPTAHGFRPGVQVRIEEWSRDHHLRALTECRAAIDIKGDDFRARHKPPAKAIDFLASGVPLAMNSDSSPVEHLSRLGFEVASPLDTDRWLSREYWEESRRFGLAIRELLSRERVGRRFKRIIDEVLAERRSR
jgi:hypothetical protein